MIRISATVTMLRKREKVVSPHAETKYNNGLRQLQQNSKGGLTNEENSDVWCGCP